jgi:ribonuclease E
MRSVESLSLSVLRLAEEHAMKDNTGQVLVQAPVEIANFLLNEKRRALAEIEQRHDAPIVIVADDQMETPHFEVIRLRENELGEESARPSYQRGTPRKLATHALTKAHLNIPPPPAVTNVKPSQPAPLREPREPAAPAAVAAVAPVATPVAAPTHSVGVVERILRFFRGQAPTAAPVAPPQSAEKRGERRGERGERGNRRDRDARRDGRPQGQAAQPRAPEQPQKPAQPNGQKPAGGKQRPPQGERTAPAATASAGPGPSGNNGGRQKRQEARDAAPTPSVPANAAARDAQPARKAEVVRVEPARAEVDNRAEPAGAESLQRVAAAAVVATEASNLLIDATEPVGTPALAGDPVETASEEIEAIDAAKADNGARRRRGRRGGRRRRRNGEGGETAEALDAQDEADGLDDGLDEAAEPLTPGSERAQPEFEFDDIPRPAAPAAIPRRVATEVTEVPEAASHTPAVVAEPAVAPEVAAGASIPVDRDEPAAEPAAPVRPRPATELDHEARSVAANDAHAPPAEAASAAASEPVDVAADRPGPVASIQPAVPASTPADAAASAAAGVATTALPVDDAAPDPGIAPEAALADTVPASGMRISSTEALALPADVIEVETAPMDPTPARRSNAPVGEDVTMAQGELLDVPGSATAPESTTAPVDGSAEDTTPRVG